MILITGAGGWLGSELTEQLLKKGESIRAFNYIETDSLKKLKEQYGEQLEIVIGDVCNIEMLDKALEDIDTIYHLAAKVHVVPTNQQEEDEFYQINTYASEKLFEKAIEKQVKRVIFFSTVSVYQQTNEKVTVHTEKQPNTIYGKSKLKAEKIANKLYQEKNFPITIIEPVTVYGEGDVGNFKKLEQLIQKGLCVRFGNGENKKTVIYYKDLITMVIKIAEDESQIGKTVICGTEVLTLNEINKILIKSSNKKVLKIYIPQWLANFAKTVCCFSVLKKIRRKIMALTQNNELEINNQLENYTKFEDYELKEERE